MYKYKTKRLKAYKNNLYLQRFFIDTALVEIETQEQTIYPETEQRSFTFALDKSS